MFQKEVAQRIAEKPGTKVYGIISVLLQAFYTIEYLFTVNENVFVPPPKVKSAVIRLRRNETKKLNCNEELFTKIVSEAANTIGANVVVLSFNQNGQLLAPRLSVRLKAAYVPGAVELPVFTGATAVVKKNVFFRRYTIVRKITPSSNLCTTDTSAAEEIEEQQIKITLQRRQLRI